MSNPIDVGSVLGGRYKVTATVLTSHDQDLVLDGVDQVLNRPVSILVAGPGNADQVAQSAREVATGERPGNVQILDLGVSDAATYLITNHTSAADLLDLVVSSNPPYVEPFFTDTLGSEIFGQPRSTEPETYDGLYDDEEVDAGYISYGEQQRQAGHAPAAPAQRMPAAPSDAPSASGRGAAAAAGAGAAGVAAAAAAREPKTAPQEATPQRPAAQPTAAQPVQAPAEAPTTGTPKVSRWEDADYAEADQRTAAGAGAFAGAGADREARSFPAFAKKSAADDDYDYDGGDGSGSDDGPERRGKGSMRWLVGALLAAVLVVGLVLAVTNLGGLFKGGSPQAAKPTSSTSTPAQSATPSESKSSAPAAAPPAIESVTRQGNFDFAATYDGDLVKTFDGNAASYWSDMEFATDGWGGFAPDGVPLVVKLKAPAQVSSVTLSQLGASGGSISVFTNDRPSLDGAKQVGSNSFTSPDLTMPLQEPVTAQYVIVSIKSLPKLAAPKTRYGYGLRLAEIKVQ
ncbi:ABC transporter substrate-binding protein [Arthrobacter sp. Hor0625]|uniref:ABC transporter substrate-binding protein n=1 Tax=Arthrobacter sp. Hor0625 TaxID=3457358 RepID=UPI00403EBF46